MTKQPNPHSIWYTDELLPDQLIQLLPKRTVYGFTVGCDVLLVKGMAALRTNWPAISADSDAMVVVFDTHLHTKKWSIPKLNISMPLLPQLRQKNCVKRARFSTTPITKLLAKTAKSFVSNFLTLSYKYDDPIAVRISVFNALATNNVPRLLKSIPSAGYSDLIALVKSEDATALTEALSLIKNKITTAQASKTTGVSTFDILYVSKFVARQPITSLHP